VKLAIKKRVQKKYSYTMRIATTLFVVLSVIFSSVAFGFDSVNIILFERNPWLMVIGSDSPLFVNYASGKTIYLTNRGTDKEAYYTVSLNKKENADLLNKLSVLDKFDDYIELTTASDQPVVELHYFNDEEVKKSSALIKRTVYGNLGRNAIHRQKAPPEILQVYDYLTGFSHKGAIPWSPAYLEVMIWPYEYAPDKSIIWHKGWPDTKSKSSIKRGDGYSIFLPYKYRQAFRDFMKTRKQKGAVVINGKKWAVATRIPFPHEIAHNRALQGGQ
jgi:hypothetical protein